MLTAEVKNVKEKGLQIAQGESIAEPEPEPKEIEPVKVEIDLTTLSYNDLIKLAKRQGLEFEKDIFKSELIELLENSE